MEVKEMPEDIKMEYNELKSEARTPIWQFVGLFLIGALVIFSMYSSKQDKKNELVYIGAPAVGDVYTVKTGEGNYSTLKVTSVSGDSVFVKPNTYEISRSTKVYKIDKAENYADYSYGIAKTELKALYDDNTISDISR